MQSQVAVTYLVDEPALAAQELYDQLSANPPGKNSVGILTCYSDMEAEELAAVLSETCAFPIIGATAIASMDHKHGFHEMAAVLLVLTADDCSFAPVLSAPITPETVVQAVEDAYREAVRTLGETPGLVIALPPYQLALMLDVYTDIFNRAAPGVPVTGGLPSYNGNGDTNAVIFGGHTYTDRMALLAIGGNIQPVFSVLTVSQNDASKKRPVTRAENNVIYRVGGKTFVEYLEEVGLPVDNLADGNTTVSFTANPLMIEEQHAEFGDTFTYMRTLHALDMKQGSGIAIGRIPAGANVSVCPLDRDAISKAAEQGISDLKEKMAEAQGYRYSTVIGISCIGRYVVMAPNGNVETDNIVRRLPEGMSLAGFYSYGEISPLPAQSSSVAFAHNESLVLCAF
ncbi:MAG: FIST C-terminal domain-containing protein [Oscillospiraceae bacterium]|nr:FIST C-terminal domain-containing protein [Oscillospiraceae bacterium]